MTEFHRRALRLIDRAREALEEKRIQDAADWLAQANRVLATILEEEPRR